MIKRLSLRKKFRGYSQSQSIYSPPWLHSKGMTIISDPSTTLRSNEFWRWWLMLSWAWRGWTRHWRRFALRRGYLSEDIFIEIGGKVSSTEWYRACLSWSRHSGNGLLSANRNSSCGPGWGKSSGAAGPTAIVSRRFSLGFICSYRSILFVFYIKDKVIASRTRRRAFGFPISPETLCRNAPWLKLGTY